LIVDRRRLVHKTPCKECPWRKASVAGYLGGHSPEWYADVVQENQVPSCHLNDFGPQRPETRFCVGALHTAANACIQVREPPHAAEAKATVGRNPDCFSHPAEFYAHHSGGKPYSSRLMRMLPR
jgi:hypothetical protein